MRKKIDDGRFETPYRLRNQVAEPVFGHIKQCSGSDYLNRISASMGGGF
jgi:hypothetical protein